MNKLVTDIAFVIEELGLERPVVAGHSWGASVALRFVARHPELASALVFVDGPLMGIARLVSWQEAQAMMQPPLLRYATMAEAAADSRRDFGEAWGEDLWPFVEARVVRDGDGWIQSMSAAARLEILRDLYASDPERLWPRVRVPAVVLAARKNDSRISRWAEQGIAHLSEIAPSVIVKRFETPHDIPLYAPAGVAEEIELLAAQDDLGLGDLRDELPSSIAD